jgi:hypothetical protein
MNIALTIPDTASDAWTLRLANYNAGSGEPPVDIAAFIQAELDIQTSRRLSEKDDADKALLAAQPQLLALGMKALTASDAKREAAISAAQAILDS